MGHRDPGIKQILIIHGMISRLVPCIRSKNHPRNEADQEQLEHKANILQDVFLRKKDKRHKDEKRNRLQRDRNRHHKKCRVPVPLLMEQDADQQKQDVQQILLHDSYGTEQNDRRQAE